jgi:nicotinamidase-related amidase
VRRALLIIDVQNDYFGGRHAIGFPAGSFPNILRAMDYAGEHGLPVALVQHSASRPDADTFRPGAPGWEIHPDVLARPHDVVIEKRLIGSFTGTTLEEWLRGRGVDTVVIAGYMTQMCCDTTARQANHLGFRVEFLNDATGTHAFANAGGIVTAEELHRATLVTQAAAFSRVLTVDEWASELGDSIPTPNDGDYQ